jgi:hypothetical protein
MQGLFFFLVALLVCGVFETAVVVLGDNFPM